MNRNRFLIALLSLGGLLGTAWAGANATSHHQRLAEFIAKAEAARKSQKLTTRDKQYAKYPTPELTLSQVVEVRPGAEATVSSGGTFDPGSLLIIPCEEVELLSSKVTAKRVEARVRVSPTALPRECDIQVHAPVSLASNSVPALRIVGDSEWDLKLANGMATRWKVKSGEDIYSMMGSSEWFSTGKPLGTRRIVVEPSSEGVRVGIERTDEESGAAMEAQESVAGGPVLTEYNALMDKLLAECSAQPAAKQIACQQKYTPRLEALQSKLNAELKESVDKSNSVSAVCDELRLTAKGGKVSGYAVNCSGVMGQIQVMGTYRMVPAGK